MHIGKFKRRPHQLHASVDLHRKMQMRAGAEAGVAGLGDQLAYFYFHTRRNQHFFQGQMRIFRH